MNKSNIPIASDRSASHVRRPTKLRPWLFSLLCSFALAARSLVAADVPPEVNIAARNGLPVFLAKVPLNSKQQYGFPDDADFSRIHLGSALLLQTIRPSALSSNQMTKTVSSVVSDTSMWFFPVLMGTEVKAMLVVDRQDNQWKAVSLGYAPLAKEWHQISNQWPASKGFHPRLIAVFQARQFYFTVPELNDHNLTQLLPATSASASAKTPAFSAGANSARYATPGECSSEIEKLKPLIHGAGVAIGR